MQTRFDDWSGPDVAGPSDLQRRSRVVSLADLAVTAASLVMAYLATAVAWFWVLLSQMAFDGCAAETAHCNYQAGSIVLIGHPLITIAALAFGSHWAVARRRERRLASFVGLSTLGGVIVIFFVAEFATHVASGGRSFGAPA